jgi:hypothetical protein
MPSLLEILGYSNYAAIWNPMTFLYFSNGLSPNFLIKFFTSNWHGEIPCNEITTCDYCNQTRQKYKSPSNRFTAAIAYGISEMHSNVTFRSASARTRLVTTRWFKLVLRENLRRHWTKWFGIGSVFRVHQNLHSKISYTSSTFKSLNFK